MYKRKNNINEIYIFYKMPKQIFAKEYEEYLITGKEEVLNSLPSGSIEKEYFILIRKLLNEELTADLQKQIDSFLERIPESQSYRLKALNIKKVTIFH